jgi:hypothetical protein
MVTLGLILSCLAAVFVFLELTYEVNLTVFKQHAMTTTYTRCGGKALNIVGLCWIHHRDLTRSMTNLLAFLHLFLGREKLMANTRATQFRQLGDIHNWATFKDESFHRFLSYYRKATVDIGLSGLPKLRSLLSWDVM